MFVPIVGSHDTGSISWTPPTHVQSLSLPLSVAQMLFSPSEGNALLCLSDGERCNWGEKDITGLLKTKNLSLSLSLNVCMYVNMYMCACRCMSAHACRSQRLIFFH